MFIRHLPNLWRYAILVNDGNNLVKQRKLFTVYNISYLTIQNDDVTNKYILHCSSLSVKRTRWRTNYKDLMSLTTADCSLLSLVFNVMMNKRWINDGHTIKLYEIIKFMRHFVVSVF